MLGSAILHRRHKSSYTVKKEGWEPGFDKDEEAEAAVNRSNVPSFCGFWCHLVTDTTNRTRLIPPSPPSFPRPVPTVCEDDLLQGRRGFGARTDLETTFVYAARDGGSVLRPDVLQALLVFEAQLRDWLASTGE